jgi:hypothetical protein
MVVNLVMITDIASPERTQISKSKWKEAFGDPFETVERKIRAEARRMSITGKEVVHGGPLSRMNQRHRGRGSMVSELSIDEGGDDYQHDDSLSGTPDNSNHGSNHDDDHGDHGGGGPIIASSATSRQNDGRVHISKGLTNDMVGRFERRMSTASRQSSSSRYRLRLGILRTVDLSGETIETYRRESMASASVSTETYSIDVDIDEPDELKATVVMEVLMTAADVAHNLQGWEHMCKWSSMLYLELRCAYQASRGADPEPRWFENQIGFLESYLLPLARRLEDTGIFGDKIGAQFAQIVEDNRDRWLTDGFDITQKSIQDGAAKFPIADESR